MSTNNSVSQTQILSSQTANSNPIAITKQPSSSTMTSRRPNLGSIAITKSNVDVKDNVPESPLKKMKTTLK